MKTKKVDRIKQLEKRISKLEQWVVQNTPISPPPQPYNPDPNIHYCYRGHAYYGTIHAC